MKKGKTLIIFGVVFLLVGLFVGSLGFTVMDHVNHMDPVERYYNDLLHVDYNKTVDTGMRIAIVGLTITTIGVVLILVGWVNFKKERRKSVKMFRSVDEATNILRTRYAKGEITKEQFEQMQKDLGK